MPVADDGGVGPGSIAAAVGSENISRDGSFGQGEFISPGAAADDQGSFGGINGIDTDVAVIGDDEAGGAGGGSGEDGTGVVLIKNNTGPARGAGVSQKPATEGEAA